MCAYACEKMKRHVEEDVPVLNGGKLHALGDRQSWLISLRLKKAEEPTKEEIAALWLLKPEAKGHIMIMGKRIQTPRYSQTYSNEGKAYNFSGTSHTALPIPPPIQRYLAYANTLCHDMLRKDYGGLAFNAVFVNWYPDGAHYIGYHSDDEKQLAKNARGETLVLSITFGAERRFLVKRKDKESKEKILLLLLTDNTVVLMGGLTQVNYKHSVPKTTVKNIGPRLNLTFRLFK